ncbi:MAG: MoaD/ThiS family protein [Sulfurospirillaceae bacterium]|jgi:sulfur carrier protein ThiS|nr:MoaD/ThiS family protein [Sulfurospirillaceae bacterium]MDD2826422.1 MoaD/ThiS family protein [Sulfurospirillaceae bacterium]
MHIILNAFSFLREKLTDQGYNYLDAPMSLPENISIGGLIDLMGLKQESVEAVFVNHKVMPKETILHDGDRIALLPPGTPGSYRLMLGIKKIEKD